MKTAIGSLVICTALLATAAADAPSVRDRLLHVALEVQGCGQQLPAYVALARELEGQGQREWAAFTYASAAGCAADLGQVEPALGYLGHAVELGYDDCQGLLVNDSARKLAGEPAMRKILGAVKMAPADFAEMTWIVSEYSAIGHDTSMMITENMNRPDGDFTAVPRSAIPSRETRSASVQISRALLAGLQIYQANVVMTSDRMRIDHNTSMRIIQSTGSTPPDMTEAIVESRRQAARRAEDRARAVAQRAFRLPAGASTTPVACSSYR